MKSSVIITLIITGGILILAPIVAAYHQCDKIAEVLPYLVAETQVEKSGDGETNQLAYVHKRLDYLQGATGPLEMLLSHRYRRDCAVFGVLLIVAGSIMAFFVKSCPVKPGNVSVEKTADGFKIEVRVENH